MQEYINRVMKEECCRGTSGGVVHKDGVPICVFIQDKKNQANETTGFCDEGSSGEESLSKRLSTSSGSLT